MARRSRHHPTDAHATGGLDRVQPFAPGGLDRSQPFAPGGLDRSQPFAPGGPARVQPFAPSGLAWVQADLPVDLPEALPGERVRYQELGRGAHRARGRLLEVLEPHPDRVPPACPLFHACGSCDRMHLRLDAQRAAKQAQVADALAPFALQIDPIVPSPLEWGYRRRAKFTFFGRSGALELGAWRAGTHEPLDLEACPVTDPRLLAARDRVRLELSRRGLAPFDERLGTGLLRYLLLQIDPASGAILAVLVASEDGGTAWEEIGEALIEPGGPGITGVALNLQPARGNALLGPGMRHLAGARSLSIRVGDRRLELPAGVFSQVNLEVAGLLYRQAAAWAGELEGGALDLYCGVGALGLHIGDRVPWGAGIEALPAAIDAANATARASGLDRWSFYTGDVDALLPRLELPGPVSLAIVNPPRKGLGPAAVRAVLERRPGRILYVSCSPASLARDLHALTAAGYAVLRARPFDMFPQTRHVETLVQLEAR